MKVVIISGKSGAGKTTISYELARVLPHYIFLDIWKIKEMFEPLNLKDRKPSNKICKDAIYFILKQTLRHNLSSNFILQESSTKAAKSYLKNYLKKGDKIYSFFLDVDLKTALKRNEEREKATMPKRHFIEQANMSLHHHCDKEDILINTSNKSIKKVVEEILKIIEEKKSSKKVNVRKSV